MARSRRTPPKEGGQKKSKSKPQAELPVPSEMERAFARDILDYPDEDARYLIFADWLEEQGDPVSLDRTELIRIQCQLAGINEEDPRHKQLTLRQKAVLGRLARTWLAPLKRYGLKVEPTLLARGMVRKIDVSSAEDFHKIDDKLFDAYPTVRELSIVPEIAMEETSESALGFVLVYPSLDVERLIAAPCLPRIHELTLTFCNLGPERMRLLAASPQVANLRRFLVADHQRQPEDDHMGEVIPLGDAGLAALASAPHLGQLRELYLWFNDIGPKEARALGSSVHLPRLRALALAHNPLGDEGARALAEAPALAQLEDLRLISTGIGPRGAAALARSPYLTRLKELVVFGQRVGRRGADLLRERFGAALDIDEESLQEPDFS